MKQMLIGLGLFLCVSFLDIGQARSAWAYDQSEVQSALHQKNYQRVVDLLSPGIDKLNRAALFELATAYSALNKHEAAIKAYNACISKNSKDYEAKTLAGNEYLKLNRDKEALAILKESMENNPRYLPTYRALIQYYEKKKNKYELRLLYEDMIAKVGETDEAITRLCELTTLDMLYDSANRYCTKGIQKTPQEPSNYVYLGLTSKETQNLEKAESYLKRAAIEFPNSELAQFTYAQFLDEKKNFINSYTYYKRAVAANPKSVPALLGLANSSLEIQKYSESLGAFERACALDKKTLPAFRRGLNSLRTMKMGDWAKKFDDAVEKCGGDF